ncbi:MAG: flagellar FliJ family protein, partial [Pseudomonadota bacterium]
NESEEIDAYITFAAYAGRLQKEIDRLNQNLSKLDLRIAKGQEELREAFAEQKKIEIIQSKRDEDDAAKEAVKESNMMDDIGIEGFRRKQGEE